MQKLQVKILIPVQPWTHFIINMPVKKDQCGPHASSSNNSTNKPPGTLDSAHIQKQQNSHPKAVIDVEQNSGPISALIKIKRATKAA